MTFQEDVHRMNEIFLDTERQFVELSYIIPPDNDPKTYSPRLYNILQMACGQAENLLRMLCEKLGLKSDIKKFPAYFKELNSSGMLEMQKVLVNRKQFVQPFLGTSDNIPDWWRGYNGTKHDLPSGYVQGNLGNTINALAGVCALHHVAYYSELEPEIVLPKASWFNHDYSNIQNPLIANSIIDLIPTSRKNTLFHCTTIFSGKGAPLG